MLTSWLRIHYAIGGKAAFPKMLQKYHTAPDLCRALETRAEARGLLGSNSPDRFFEFDAAMAQATERLCRENGWRIVPYPSDCYPALLRRIKDPPAVLFVRGDIEILKNPRMVAAVGTRTASRRAADASVLLGEALAGAGVTVVSGGANGVDSAAALGASGVVGAGCVTVLGRGFDPAPDAGPPAENAVFVTELFPGLSGRAFNFPRRNRVISGVSAGTVVMEAGGKSGSLITADYAVRQGRLVFVPDAASLPSPGCAALIAKGAKEIACPRDCVEALFPDFHPDTPGSLSVRWAEAPRGRYEQSFYGVPERGNAPPEQEKPPDPSSPPEPPLPEPVRGEKVSPPIKAEIPPERRERKPQTRPLPEGLSPEARAVAAALTEGPRYVDELIDRLGLPAPQVQIAVTELELEDAVTVGPGGRVSLR